MTAPVPEDVAARYIVFEHALLLSGKIAEDHPLEAVKLGGPPLHTTSTVAPAELRRDITIDIANWLLGA